ncbi:hypothetical protein FRC02_011495 [Tulasnella sp. 418]|nr:hypothetical protein FRC02_011495 [Tulasnella sp. 418]
MFKLGRSARQRRPSSRPRFRPLVKKTFSAVKTGLKQHICFGAPNKRETFECDEEPIVLSGADGYGYFPATLGQRLDNDRFEIVRKLGWGQFSSVWLARDLSMDRQPLPNFDLKEDGSNLHIRIADFGHATWIDKRYEEEDVQPVGLRAPEVILGHPWSTPIDIWAVGCLAFELLIGTAFFDPVAGKTWKLEDNHLQRMLEVTGEKFSSKMLAQSKRREQYLDSDGSLIRIKYLSPVTFEDCIRNYNLVPEHEAQGAADFMRRCLRLDPDDRPTAAELIGDKWLLDA